MLFSENSRSNFRVISGPHRAAIGWQYVVGRRAPQHIGVGRMNAALDMEPSSMAVTDRWIDCSSLKRLINGANKTGSSASERERATSAFPIFAGGIGFGFGGDAAERSGRIADWVLCFHRRENNPSFGFVNAFFQRKT